jgi:hypothetical protein
MLCRSLTDPTHIHPDPMFGQSYDSVLAGESTSSLRVYSSEVGWMACCHVSDEDVPRIVAELECFDFRVCCHVSEKDIVSVVAEWRDKHRPLPVVPWDFDDFLAWLYRLVHSLYHSQILIG